MEGGGGGGANYMILNGDSLSVTSLTCETSTFGRPRSSFTARDSSVSGSGGIPRITVEVAGTDPDPATYPVVEGLEDSSATVEAYHQAVNYMAATGTVTYSKSGSTRTITGMNLELPRASGSGAALTASFHFSCTL